MDDSVNSSNHPLSYIKSPPSVAIADRVRQLTTEGTCIATLQTGEPCFDTPEYIIQGAYTAMQNGHTHYSATQGLLELRQALAKWYEETYRIRIAPGQILITHGAIHAVLCALNAILNVGDEVVIPEPYWPQYANMSILAGGIVKNIDTREQNGIFSKDALNAAITEKTKVLILNNPCNPSGVVYSQSDRN